MQVEDDGIIYKDESYKIQGAIYEVYKEIGPGFLESVYQECLEKEFILCGIPYTKQVDIKISYKGQQLDQFYKADLICYDSIIIEVKARNSLDPTHRAQIINYLRATGKRLGLLVNFNSHPKVTIERIVL
jgi:GxxExxY protein